MEQIPDGQLTRPKFKLIRIGFENEEFVINRNKICVGRHPSNNLTCCSTLVSRNHAEIFILNDDLLCVEDKKSSNGTFINSEFITPFVKLPLYGGDVISFGVSELPSDEVISGVYAYKVVEILPPCDNQDVINVSDEETEVLVGNVVREEELKLDENVPVLSKEDSNKCDSDVDCVELPFDSSRNRSLNLNNDNSISDNNVRKEENEPKLNEIVKSLKRKLDSSVNDLSIKKNNSSIKKSFQDDSNDVVNDLQQISSKKHEKINQNSNMSASSSSSCRNFGQNSKSSSSKHFNDNLDDVLLEVSKNEDLRRVENVVMLVDDNEDVLDGIPINSGCNVNKKSEGNKDVEGRKDLSNKNVGKKKVKDFVNEDNDIKENEDCNYNVIKNDKRVIKSKKSEGKENGDNNSYSSISENIKKRGKRRIENSSVSKENLEVKKLKKNSKEESMHEKRSKSKSKSDKATVDSDSNLKNGRKDKRGRYSSSKSKKDKESESNERNRVNDVNNLAKADEIDDVIIVEDDDHFENSDEEEFFCSQIFNTTDLDCDIKEEVKVKEEPQEEREGIDENDVIIIDDDGDDEENDDFEKWYGRLSQSFFETDPDEKKDTSKTVNGSAGNIFDLNEIIGFNGEVSSDDEDKNQEKDLQDEINSRKVKVMVEDISKRKEQKEVVSTYDKGETSKKKSDRKAIFTEALPLPSRSKVNAKKVVESKKDSLNDKKKPDVPKDSVKKDVKEIRREKLKAIADKNAEKKDKSKNESKPSTVVTKVTSRSRNDFLMESMVHENKTSAPRRSLRNEFKIPKIKIPKEKIVDESKASPKEKESSCSSSNVVQKVEVSAKTVVTFADKPTIHYIDILPGSKLLPCNKKDAPLRKTNVENDIDVNYVVQTAPHYSVDETLYAILRWKVAWLEVYNTTEVPNVSNNKVGPRGISNTRKEYKNFREYFCVYQELLLHETWSHIKDSFCMKSRKLQATSFKIDSQTLRKVESSVIKVAEQKSFLVIRCHRYITEDELKCRSYQRAFEYGIITMQVYSKNKDKKRTCYNFCFIEAVDICRIHPQELYQNNFFSEMLKNGNSNLKRINLTLLIKPLDCDQIIDTQVEVQLKVISFIKPLLRLFSSISSLPKSPLQQLIFNPNSHDFTIGELPLEMKRLPSLNKLNVAQQEAVISCTKLCLSPKPNIALIHGPPGTGKSHVIINIIEQIFQTSRQKPNRFRERPKVLLCAPSNLAVDLLVERLLDLREEMKAVNSKMKLSIVRIGQVDPKNHRVASVGLERLAAARLSDELCDDIPVELSLLSARINSLKLVKEKTTNNNMSTKETDERLAELMRKKLELETITPEMYNKKRHVFDRNQIRISETNILRGADIICSTLSSCVVDSMQTAFITGDEDLPKITCCIIDEASQCCEPEIIIPAQLNITKFVLVGDHKQLPATVVSELSRSRGLGNSLFLRIFSCWESSGRKLNSTSPIHSLDTQYRMHSSIMNWPSKYFYNGALKSGYDEKKYNYPISHYMVLNHCYVEDPNNKECNPEEANLVMELALAILHAEGCSDLTVGIITPYRCQRSILLDKLNESCNDVRVKMKVKINTVDGFQGTEQDVIIMSCVRSSGIGFLADEQRLNVAVTRAKHSLIICANFDAFKNNQHWSSLLENSKQRKKYFSFKDNVRNIRDVLPKIILN